MKEKGGGGVGLDTGIQFSLSFSKTVDTALTLKKKEGINWVFFNLCASSLLPDFGLSLSLRAERVYDLFQFLRLTKEREVGRGQIVKNGSNVKF